MTSDNLEKQAARDALEDAIVEAIRAGKDQFFVIEHDSKVEARSGGKFRAVDMCLQRLRRNGVLKYANKKWSMA